MRQLLLVLALLAATTLSLVPATAFGFSHDVSVRGSFRRDGTYVQPHRRTRPDSNPYNNYSTYPNINPYTGQQGTRHPQSLWQDYQTTPQYDYGWGGRRRR